MKFYKDLVYNNIILCKHKGVWYCLEFDIKDDYWSSCENIPLDETEPLSEIDKILFKDLIDDFKMSVKENKLY